MKLFDMHVHVGQFNLLRDDIQALLKKKPFEIDADMPTLFSNSIHLEKYLRSNGVERAVILAECGPGTNYTIDSEMVTKFAGNNTFFIPFGSINPNYHNVEKEFWKSVEIGVRGFKLYPADHSFDPSQKEMVEVYQYCEERHLPIMFHTGLTAQRDAKEQFINPTDFIFIAKKFPKLNLILAHAGKPHWYNEAIEILATYSNVYVDTGLVSPEDLKYLSDNTSDITNKILFGSDWPVAGSYSQLTQGYLNSGIDEEVLQKIMFNNANNLFNKILELQEESQYV